MMKKMVKISCVAALALASFQVVSAKPLNEAIKGVDVSGSVAYRYQEQAVKDGPSSAFNGYKAALNVKAPINKYLKVNTRFLVGGGPSGASAAIMGSGQFAKLSNFASTTGGDKNPSATLAQANFEVNVGMVKAIVGKQGLTTPWTVASSKFLNEQDGTGALFFVNTKYATVAAGYFNQTNLIGATVDGVDTSSLITGNNDIYTAAVIVPIGGFAINAWYLDMADVLTTYTAGITGSQNVAGIKLGVDARYTGLTFNKDIYSVEGTYGDPLVGKTNSLAKIVVSAKRGMFGAKLAYAMTGDHGYVALDDDAQTSYKLWNVSANDKDNASLIYVSANADLIAGLNVSVNYDTMDFKVDKVSGFTDSEYYAQLTYKMGKNFNTYLKYGEYDQKAPGLDTKKQNGARLQATYSF